MDLKDQEVMCSVKSYFAVSIILKYCYEKTFKCPECGKCFEKQCVAFVMLKIRSLNFWDWKKAGACVLNLQFKIPSHNQFSLT